MGSNQFGIAVYGAGEAEVLDALHGWLQRRGFVRREEPVPPRLHPQKERGARIYRAERAVVVCFSELGELQRLAFELRKLGHPTLLAWQHDSSMLGYELWSSGKVVSAWSSEPDDPEITGPDDLDALAAATGSEAVQVRSARARRWIFAEAVSGPLFASLGAAPLAGIWDDPHPSEHLAVWFRVEGWDPWADFDLTRPRFKLGPVPEAPAADLPPPWKAPLWLRALSWILWPFGLVIRWLLRGRALGAPSPWREEGGELVNGGARLRLPEGARGGAFPFVQATDLFIVDLGDGALAFLREHSPSDYGAHPVVGPGNARLVDAERPIGAWPGRWVLVESPAWGHVPARWTLTWWFTPPGRLLQWSATGAGTLAPELEARIVALGEGLGLGEGGG